jgi:hypothetical protein
MTKWEDLAILRPFDDAILRGACDEKWIEYNEILEHEYELTKARYDSKTDGYDLME